MRWITGFSLLLLLIACDDKPPARTVFDASLQAHDKARAVEGKLQESAERRGSDIERVEGAETK